MEKGEPSSTGRKVIPLPWTKFKNYSQFLQKSFPDLKSFVKIISPSLKQVKFSPKAPPRRKPPQSTLAKTEEVSDDDKTSQAQHLLRRFNENIARRGSKVDKKSLVQVSFGPGPDSSASPRTYDVVKEGNSGKRSVPEPTTSNHFVSSIAISKADEPEHETLACSKYTETGLTKIPKKEYKDPWDYHNSYYPTTLPFRRPYSGNPELLDEVEFGHAATKVEYDESTINPASELGLLEESGETKMLFFQFPSSLPELKRLASSKGKEKVGSSDDSKKCFGLEDLQSGLMGKMLVYKSGAMKLKLGDNLYDVAPGSDCVFAQDVATINTVDRQCCVLGELRKRAVVTPDVESLLKSVVDLG